MLFGDNRFNFFGWIVAGLLIFAVSLVCALYAIRAGIRNSAECHLLLGIQVLLIGLFGIAWQNYCARLAEKIEAEDAKKDK